MIPKDLMDCTIRNTINHTVDNTDLTQEETQKYFQNFKTYKKLMNPKSYLYTESSQYIAELTSKEIPYLKQRPLK